VSTLDAHTMGRGTRAWPSKLGDGGKARNEYV